MMLIFVIEYLLTVRDTEEGGDDYSTYESVHVIAENIAKAVAAFENQQPKAEISTVTVLRDVIVA